MIVKYTLYTGAGLFFPILYLFIINVTKSEWRHLLILILFLKSHIKRA